MQPNHRQTTKGTAPGRFLRLAAAAILIAAALASSASACPTCKENLAENGGNLALGFYYSILFMVSMPFLILGGLSTYFYWEVRRARARQAAERAALEAALDQAGDDLRIGEEASASEVREPEEAAV